MTTIRAAYYARVSSEQQATAHTIESQTAALSERAQSDGTPVPPERQFVDDGHSGASLIRPALDRLRDLATVGAIDRIYVHSPDRLARNYAYQVLLLDEWRRRGVELVFLNRTPGPAVRLNPDLPPKLEEIINKCLEKDRNLRYQHASDIRTDLQRLKRDTESGKAVSSRTATPRWAPRSM